MMMPPIMARQTVPLPPESETPPSTTAVRAWNSQPTAGRGIGAGLARGVEDAAEGTERAGQHVGGEQHALDLDAGMARRLAAGADGQSDASRSASG